MRLQSAILAAGLVLALAACGDDEGARPTTPVTLKFRTDVYPGITGTADDTVKGIVIVDGTDTLQLPYDSLVNVPRGEHSFEARLSVDYLPSIFTVNVNPRGNTAVIDVFQAGSCRVFFANNQPIDAEFCVSRTGEIRNALYWSQHDAIYCSANDFLEFCSPFPDQDGLGLTWPFDVASSRSNEYVTQGKLLIAATVAPELGGTDGGRRIATALYRVGDYAPRRRLQVAPNDSSRYSNVVWTDVRHVPIYNFTEGQLEPSDRRRALFGLEVKATYFLPQAHQDALIVRYDVTNISDRPDYRIVHPTVPEGGFTLRDIYLTPAIDPDVGNPIRLGASTGEAADDAGTVFASDNLVVAWDRQFSVSFWASPWNTAPGVVGLQFLNSDAGTARGVVFTGKTPDYELVAREAEAHAIISAGRGPNTSTDCRNFSTAYVCGAETGGDVRMGWSVGPIASLAPGETRQVTVALLLARPNTPASGTVYAPGNDTEAAVDNPQGKSIYPITQNLRTLAGQVANVTVTPAP